MCLWRVVSDMPRDVSRHGIRLSEELHVIMFYTQDFE